MQFEAFDVAPFVLGFNYEKHNASGYKFDNSASYADPIMNLHTKFPRNRTIGS